MANLRTADDDRPELALEVVHTASDSVARLILEEGIRYSQALQIASHALDARATQVATILFAAAALSAGAIGTKFEFSNVLAIGSTVMFIWGGLISFRSVQSGEFRTPGLPPYWWAEGVLALTRDQNDKADFSEQDAMSWAAKEQQRGIDANCKENIERANALNASLRAGFVGAVMVCFAASFKIWPEVIAFAQKNF